MRVQMSAFCDQKKKKINAVTCSTKEEKAVILRVKHAANCHGHLNLQRQPALSTEPVHHCGDESVVCGLVCAYGHC